MSRSTDYMELHFDDGTIALKLEFAAARPNPFTVIKLSDRLTGGEVRGVITHRELLQIVTATKETSWFQDNVEQPASCVYVALLPPGEMGNESGERALVVGDQSWMDPETEFPRAIAIPPGQVLHMLRQQYPR